MTIILNRLDPFSPKSGVPEKGVGPTGDMQGREISLVPPPPIAPPPPSMAPSSPLSKHPTVNQRGFHFKPYEMIVTSEADWKKTPSAECLEVTSCLKSYHRIPKEKIDERIRILFELTEKVKKALEDKDLSEPAKRDLKVLLKQASYKSRYLLAIWKILKKKGMTQLAEILAVDKEGGRPLSQDYWLERVDPLHRNWSGQLLQAEKDKWLSSGTASLWLWLEGEEQKIFAPVRGDFKSERFEMLQQCVSHMNAQKRAKYRLEIRKGASGAVEFYRNGEKYDTSEEITDFTKELGPGTAIFVLGPDGEIYTNSHVKGVMHHSSFFGGQAVQSAGEIVIEGDKLISIGDKSGHYKPQMRHLLKMLQKLRNMGCDLSEVKLYQTLKTPQGGLVTTEAGVPISATYNAQRYLETQGQCKAIEDNKSFWSPLQISAWNGQIEIFKKLLDEDPTKLQFSDTDGKTVLHILAKTAPIYDEDLAHAQEIEASWKKFQMIAEIALERGEDIASRDKKGKTPLYYAIESGNGATIKFFYDALKERQKKLEEQIGITSDPKVRGDLEKQLAIFQDETDLTGKTPLICAIEEGVEETVQHLLNLGIDPTSRSKDGKTPLEWAIQADSPFMIELLLRHLDTTVITQDETRNILGWAVKIGNPQVVNLIFEKLISPVKSDQVPKKQDTLPYRVDIDAILPKGKTLLQMAVSGEVEAVGGNLDIVRLLLDEKGVSIEVKDLTGQTPLHAAAVIKFPEIATILLEHKALINSKDAQGQTPLNFGVKKMFGTGPTFNQTVLFLLGKGADPNIPDHEGNSPLHLLCKTHSPDLELVNILLYLGAEISTKNSEGKSPIALALEHKQINLFLSLIDPIERKSKAITAAITRLEKRKATSETMRQEIEKEIQELKKKKEQLPQTSSEKERNRYIAEAAMEIDSSGKPLIARIAEKKHGSQTLDFLLKAGADPFQKDTITGHAPLFWAVRSGAIESVQLLVKHLDASKISPQEAIAILEECLRLGEFSILKALTGTLITLGRTTFRYTGATLPYRFYINDDLPCGMKPLYLAVKSESVKCVRFLIEAGAHTIRKDIKGRTPLHYAAANPHSTIARLLIEKGALVNYRDEEGRLPLHYAMEAIAKRGSSMPSDECALYLLNISKYYMLNTKDYGGTTPLDLLGKKTMISAEMKQIIDSKKRRLS